MLPVLPLRQTYFSFDEVCQWVDIAPEALKYWLSSQGTQPYDTHIVKASMPIERRYHRREVIWLCKAKPAIEEMARCLLPKQEDPYAYVRQELSQLLGTLKAAGVAGIHTTYSSTGQSTYIPAPTQNCANHTNGYNETQNISTDSNQYEQMTTYTDTYATTPYYM